MPNWSGGILTTKGQALQAKVDAGQTKLIVTKMKVGSGVLPNGQNLQSLNDLVAPEMNVPISAVSANANISTIVGVITNAGLTNGFNVRELGVYAQDPILGEILYSITTDSAPDYLPPEGGAVVVSEEFSINIVVSNTANVTATINPNGLVTISILDQKVSEHNIDPNAHNELIANHNSNINAHAELLHLWQPNYAYTVGGICYSATGASYKRFECVVAGISGAKEPNWGAISTTIADGTATWKVCDIRQGTTIGKILALIDVGSGIAGLPAIDGSLLSKLTANKLTGALPAIDGSLLTGVVSSGSGWVKFSDGTMIQRGASGSSNSGANPAYASIVFPLAFYNTNYTIMAMHSGTLPLICAENSPDKNVNQTVIWLQRNDGTLSPVGGWTAQYLAIGRWKA